MNYRIARIERLIMALRDCDIGYLNTLKNFEILRKELSIIADVGSTIDEVISSMADLIEEVLENE